MKYLKWGLPILVVLAAFFVSKVIRSSRPDTPVAEIADLVPSVRVMRTKTIQYQPMVYTQGTARPKREIDLVPEVAGKVVWVSPTFTEGGYFNAGDVLVRIDPRNYEFAIQRARAGLADAVSKLALERAEGDIASQDWAELGEGAPSALTLREPQLAGAKAAMASAQAALDQAEVDLTRTQVRAPFNGRVDVKRIDIGQYVSLGTLLATLYSTDIAQVYLPVTDRQLGRLDLRPTYANDPRSDKETTVELSAMVGDKRRSWQGQIARTSASFDPKSRVLDVIVEVKNPYDVKPGGVPLIKGLFVDAKIPGIMVDNVVSIPNGALRNQSQVVVVDTDSKMWSRDVDVIHTGPQSVQVRGIEDGALIVTSPLEIMIEGTKVTWSEEQDAS